MSQKKPTPIKVSLLLILSMIGMNTVQAGNICDQQTTAIQDIQGDQKASTMPGQSVWVKGVMTGDFRGPDSLGGFFLQNPSHHPNLKKSSGLFISHSLTDTPVKAGDMVLVQGVVSEEFDVTHLTEVKVIRVCQSGLALPEPVALQLPMNLPQLEATEGMRVTLAQPHVVTDVYNYLRFGELVVSQDLMLSPTAQYRPGSQVKKHAKLIKKSQLIIDDGLLSKYPLSSIKGADGQSAITASNPIRIGHTIQATGIMHYAFGRFKLQATEALKLGDALASSAAQPDMPQGALRVGTFNVENFFNSLDLNENKCGPLKDFGCRGADSSQEFKRQLAKLVAVINSTDASVLGIQELENNDDQSIKALVEGLNAAAGEARWAYIDTGALGEDVIKVGLIYQPKMLQPKGSFALLNQAADPEFLEHRNRIVVTQTFEHASGHAVNVATVHFKSKSCRDAVDLDLDQKDGQSCFNPTRIQVANQVARWLAKDPTGQGAQATFLVGDFNSYQKEDPMQALWEHGYVNTAAHYLGEKNWTASYRGMLGSLDYVLANQAAMKLTKGASQWHINSVSSRDFGYNLEPLDEGVFRPVTYYQADPYSSSDHDVVLTGFDFPTKQ